MPLLSLRRFFYLKPLTRAIAITCGFCASSGVVQGAGFALNESSVSAAGTAFAGRVAAPQDASVIASNPGAISFLEGEQWTVGGALVAPTGSVKVKSATSELGLNLSSDGDGEPFTRSVFVPGVYYTMPLPNDLTFGLGLYVPFGLETDYDWDFAGRYLALNSHLQNINLQPTLSYRLSDTIGLGIGVFLSHIEGRLTQNKISDTFRSEVVGDDVKMGVKLGALWNDGPYSFGIAWTSNVDFKVEGSVKIKGRFFGRINSKADAHLKLKTPQMFELGGSCKIDDELTLVVGAMWTGWNSFKEIKVILDENLNVPGRVQKSGSVASYTPEHWKKVWSFSAGGRYQLNNEWQLRFGYAFDQSPVPDKYRTARIPDGDRNWITVGARYQMDKLWLVDMAYGYLIPYKIKVDEVAHSPDGTPGTNPSFKGKYTMSAHILMAALTYRY